MALRVIGAGLGRTGTLSLKLALEYLGFMPCHHMVEFFAAMPTQLPLWLDAIDGKPDWDVVFDGFQACVDYPACHHWRALADHYPDAKIILSVRDPESWYKSCSSTIFSEGMLGMMLNSPLKSFFEGTVVADFRDKVGDRDFMVDYFRRWNETVIAQAPPERLLVFEAKQGWAPLCAFLGVPVPDIPYPRVNSTEEMQARNNADDAQGGRPSGPPPPEIFATMAQGHIQTARAQAFGADWVPA